MRVLLLSTYDLGHQPFGLASPAAWLRKDGHQVTVADLSRDKLAPATISNADWIAIHLPMHTATRLALPHLERIRSIHPDATLICYGLYAPVNAEMLRQYGVKHIIGGEFEGALASLISGRSATALPIVLDRLQFETPDRTGLPPLSRYATLTLNGETRVAGYTEASRGCKHLCRHCPIVPVYKGRFRIVPRETVLADIRQQVAAGATHITFGDPDFLNGPGHALPLVEELHAEFPHLTYDATIKVEHLLQHPHAVGVLARTGCLFIVSAVESLNDEILNRLAKGHTRADFVKALELTRANGLAMMPTFVTFTPWTTREDYLDLLRTIRDLDLVQSVAPIQLAIRLLIPSGSKLLDLPDLGPVQFEPESLQYVWKHPDPAMDELCRDLQKIVRAGDKRKASREEIFREIWQRAFGEPPDFHLPARATVPYLNEPWYC